MRQKGFTLIELLATLVILGIVMIVAVQSYQNLTANSNQTKYEYYKEIIINASDLVLESRKNIMESGECFSVSYQDLVDKGKVKEDDITCTGSIQLTKTGKKFIYNDENLECKNKNDVVLKEKTANVGGSCIAVNVY